MYTLKGFLTFSPLINNDPDQVAMFGEISPNSLTYAKDKTFHTIDTATQTTLIAFHSVRNESAVDVPITSSTNALKLGQFILSQSLAGTLPSDPYVFRQLLMAEFNGYINDLLCGEIKSNGVQQLPEWIQYTDLTLTEEPSTVTLWMSDESFANQYDEFSIEVIPPLVPVDDFFKDPLAVKLLLDDYNLVEKIEEVQQRRGKYPYTLQQALRYDYQNPADTSFKVPTYWLVVVYGQAGNNPDLIKEAIVEYVLDNSTHTREEWITVLPDLFLTTEFVITPLWPNYSVPNAQFQAGIHSPIIDHRKGVALLKLATKGGNYTPAWIDAQCEFATMLYKSLAFGIVGNPENRLGVVRFSTKFPDYMLVTNDSADANRMSPETAEWISKFSALVKTAETFTRYSNVPVGMSRVIRGGIVYVSAFYKNVNYLVASKPSVETLQ
jgi:hypothetical protein